MQDTLMKAKAMIDSAMENGIDIKSIHDLATMIRDVQTIEGYTHSGSTPDNHKLKSHNNWLLEHIEDELAGTHGYLDMWHKTSNQIYKDMAKDELTHAGNLIDVAREKGFSDGMLKEFVSKYMELSKNFM